MENAEPSRDVEPKEQGLMDLVRGRTPARILLGRAAATYRTETLLELRSDHAAARDAVTTEVNLVDDLGQEFLDRWGLFEVATRARTKQEFLLRPDLGRSLDDAARDEIRRRCQPGAEIQVAIGDGLSAAAIAAQVPALLPLLQAESTARGFRFGQPVFIRHCRVGVLNDLGELLDPSVAIILIGERPGMSTALGLSAYMAFRPRPGDDDSRRNLVSGIHDRGVPPDQAARRILSLAEQMMHHETSGIAIKEGWADSGTMSIEG